MKNREKKNILLKEISMFGAPVGVIQLSKILDIPQATLGRMMLSLEQEGFIEKVSNKGRVITEKGVEYLNEQETQETKQKEILSLIETVNNVSRERLLEIIEVRQLIEVKAIEGVCMNANENDIDALEIILLEHIYNHRHGGYGHDLDLRFHLFLAELSGNKTIYQILKLILTENEVYAKFSMVGENFKNLQIQQHRDIIEGIKEKDLKKAKDAMYIHLEKVKEEINMYYDNLK